MTDYRLSLAKDGETVLVLVPSGDVSCIIQRQRLLDMCDVDFMADAVIVPISDERGIHDAVGSARELGLVQ